MEKFYIDRQFGPAIWIEVEKGIVQRCYNEEKKFIDKMNELYKGKSITFLNEDFIGRAMKGTYHNLRCDSIVLHRVRVESCKDRVRQVNAKIRELKKYYPIKEENKKQKEESLIKFKEHLDEHEHELSELEKALENETQRILKVHDFQS